MAPSLLRQPGPAAGLCTASWRKMTHREDRPLDSSPPQMAQVGRTGMQTGCIRFHHDEGIRPYALLSSQPILNRSHTTYKFDLGKRSGAGSLEFAATEAAAVAALKV